MWFLLKIILLKNSDISDKLIIQEQLEHEAINGKIYLEKYVSLHSIIILAQILQNNIKIYIPKKNSWCAYLVKIILIYFSQKKFSVKIIIRFFYGNYFFIFPGTEFPMISDLENISTTKVRHRFPHKSPCPWEATPRIYLAQRGIFQYHADSYQ